YVSAMLDEARNRIQNRDYREAKNLAYKAQKELIKERKKFLAKKIEEAKGLVKLMEKSGVFVTPYEKDIITGTGANLDMMSSVIDSNYFNETLTQIRAYRQALEPALQNRLPREYNMLIPGIREMRDRGKDVSKVIASIERNEYEMALEFLISIRKMIGQ
ncbi:MAG: hypothetical protein QW728_00885, partial [Thermoplasmata archaeon]